MWLREIIKQTTVLELFIRAFFAQRSLQSINGSTIPKKLRLEGQQKFICNYYIMSHYKALLLRSSGLKSVLYALEPEVEVAVFDFGRKKITNSLIP